MSALTTEDRCVKKIVELVQNILYYDRRAAMPILVEEMYKSVVENLNNSESAYSLEQVGYNALTGINNCELQRCSSFPIFFFHNAPFSSVAASFPLLRYRIYIKNVNQIS